MFAECNAKTHGLRTPRREVAFISRPKKQSQSQIFRYGRSIFCLPHQPNFLDIFDLCLHWVSVVCVLNSSMPTEQNYLENDRDDMYPVHSALCHLCKFFYIDWLKSNLKEFWLEPKILLKVRNAWFDFFFKKSLIAKIP